MASALDILRRAAGLSSPVPESRAASTLKEPADWLWDALGGQRSTSGESVSVTSALGIDAVYAAVSLLAGTAATLPLIVYAGRGAQRRRADGDPRYRLLHDGPNPETPADQFVENVMAHIALWGNAYAEKVRSTRTGVVGELWPILPSRVRVERDRQGRKRFTIDGEPRTLGTDTILHIPGFGYDGLCGLSVVGMARNTLGTAQARARFEGELFANDATPGGIIKGPRELTSEAAARLKAGWEAAHTGAGNRRRVAVLEDGFEWQSTGLPMDDLQFIERERFTVNQVARMFGVPPEMIGGDRNGSLTYSTVEGQAIQFVTFSLRRWLVRIEKALKHDPDLFPEPDVYPEFLIDGLLRADARTRADVYEAHVRMGTMTRNEIRARENLPPLDGGDEVAPDAAPSAEPEQDEVSRMAETALGLSRLGLANSYRLFDPAALRDLAASVDPGLGTEPPPTPPADAGTTNGAGGASRNGHNPLLEATR